MYHVGHRLRHHYMLYGTIGAVLLVLVVGGVIAGRIILQPHTTLVQSKPIINQVTGSNTSYHHWVTKQFAIDLPDDWATTAPPATPYNSYSYHGTSASSSPRHLDIYVGSVPLDLAVNRLLPVQPDGDQLVVTGVVSDNCVNFTDKTPASETSGVASSKWGGVNFLCDMGNYGRHVVAIGSTEGVNTITLTGPTTGAVHVLLVYTDNNNNPSYNTFITIAKSFQLL